MIFIFNLSMWHITLIVLIVVVEPSLPSWNRSLLIMMYDRFNVLLNSICKCFLEDFCICVHKGYWPVIFLYPPSLCIHLLCSFGLMWHLRLMLPYWFSVFVIYPWCKWHVKVTIIALLSVSSFRSVNVCFMLFLQWVHKSFFSAKFRFLSFFLVFLL